jgi:hypothetical protein
LAGILSLSYSAKCGADGLHWEVAVSCLLDMHLRDAQPASVHSIFIPIVRICVCSTSSYKHIRNALPPTSTHTRKQKQEIDGLKRDTPTSCAFHARSHTLFVGGSSGNIVSYDTSLVLEELLSWQARVGAPHCRACIVFQMFLFSRTLSGLPGIHFHDVMCYVPGSF